MQEYAQVRKEHNTHTLYIKIQAFVLKSFLVVDKIQNTKLNEFPVLYIVFCRPLGATLINVKVNNFTDNDDKFY